MAGPTVVALGDSITVGVGDGAQDPLGPSGWAAHVAAGLGAGRFVNLAVNGTRARSLGDTQVPSALMELPDVVLLTVGGNDVLRGDFDAREIERHVRDALVRLTRPGRVVCLATIDRIGLFDLVGARVGELMGRRVVATNAALLRAAIGTGAVVVDGAAALAPVGPRAWHIDRVHPSALGHRALAARTLMTLNAPRAALSAIPPAPPSPALGSRVWWLARHGTPWVAKRSRDLIPQVAGVVAHELAEDRRRRRAAPA